MIPIRCRTALDASCRLCRTGTACSNSGRCGDWTSELNCRGNSSCTVNEKSSTAANRRCCCASERRLRHVFFTHIGGASFGCAIVSSLEKPDRVSLVDVGCLLNEEDFINDSVAEVESTGCATVDGSAKHVHASGSDDGSSKLGAE